MTQAPDGIAAESFAHAQGRAKFREYRAMVTARHVGDRGGQHGAAGIDEDMIDQ